MRAAPAIPSPEPARGKIPARWSARVAGAAIGSQFGGGTGERVAAGVAGAAIGGILGNRIGAAMDDEDKRRAYVAQMDALERGPSGAPVAWENPDSGPPRQHRPRPAI